MDYPPQSAKHAQLATVSKGGAPFFDYKESPRVINNTTHMRLLSERRLAESMEDAVNFSDLLVGYPAWRNSAGAVMPSAGHANSKFAVCFFSGISKQWRKCQRWRLFARNCRN